MALNIKHIADLLDCKFNIPDYQRGYRWEEKHVRALLDDLLDFGKSLKRNGEGQFYCLQPLAVTINHKLSNVNDIVYDVIDGQQRLTTIFLLLTYLEPIRSILNAEEKPNIYSLTYECRDADFFREKKFANSDETTALQNIDFFYMTRAYKTIERYFQEPAHQNCIGIILKQLIPDGYVSLSTAKSEAEVQQLKEDNDTLNDARFIWYEVESKSESKLKSIDVFNSLNYGKTALTPAELVKALLLQCDLYETDKSVNAEKAFRRSCEWDTIEKELQNEFFWAMLCPKDELMKNHISLVLYYVCSSIQEEYIKDCKNKNIEPEKYNYKFEDDDFTYLVCNEFLGKDAKQYAQRVDEFWNRVQKTYTMFRNWFENREIFHLVGLLTLLNEPKKSKTMPLKDRIKLFKEWIKEYETQKKPLFRSFLINEIGKKVKIVEKEKQDGIERIYKLDEIHYGAHDERIIRILLLFNIDLIIREKNEKTLFPFHKFRYFNITSLEHIHPQNLIFESLTGKQLKEWADVKLSSLQDLESKGGDNSKFKLTDEKRQLFVDLKNCIDPNDKITKIEEAQMLAKKIDEDFNDLVDMEESQMHTLYNMALVDKETNSSLSNNLLDEKRNILINRNNSGQTYAMPGTKFAFTKFFSQEVMVPKLWTLPDRKAYFNEIKKVYDEYTKDI